MMRPSEVYHARRGRPTIRWEDILVRNVGVDWQSKAAEANSRAGFDPFRDSVYKEYKLAVPEHRRSKSIRAHQDGPKNKLARIAPMPDLCWEEPAINAPQSLKPRCILQDCHGSVRFGFGSVGSSSVRFRFVPVPVQFRFRFAFFPSKINN